MTSVNALSGSSQIARFAQLREAMFSKMDTDGSGTVNKSEFVSARPKNVTEAEASALYDKIDADKSNELTQDQLDAGLEANRPGGDASSSAKVSNSTLDAILSLVSSILSQLQDSSGANADAGGQSAAEMFAKIDVDGDGNVTKEEFVSARPSDVSEDQANQLFASIDTEGTGSITQSQFEAATPKGPPGGPGGPAGAGGPPPPPPSGENASSGGGTQSLEAALESILSASSTTSSDGTSASANSQAVSLIQELLKAIQSSSTTATA